MDVKPKNILFISARSDLSGGPVHLNEILLHLKGKPEFNVFVAAPENEHFSEGWKNLTSGFFKLDTRSFSIIKLFKLKKFIKQNKVTLIHSHGRGAGIYSRLLKTTSLKIIHTYHGIHMVNSVTGIVKYLVDLILQITTDKLIFVAESEKNKAKSLYLALKDNVVIKNGIKLIKKIPKSERNSKITIGVTARDDFQKGLDILFRNMNIFKQKNPNLEFILLIAGAAEIPKYKKDYIHFLGHTNNTKFFNEIDFFISCSRWEGLPLAVLEAMSAKIPCLLSNVVGHDYFICSNTALSFQLDNTEQFCEMLHSLITQNQDFRINIAYNLVFDEHQTKKMCLKLLSLYNKEV